MIITLTGPNTFAVDEFIKTKKQAFISKYGEVSYQKLDGEEATAEQLTEAATSLPFLAAQKLVVLKNPGAQKQFAENIEQTIGAVSDNVEVIIIEPKIDKRSTYFKVLKTNTDFKEMTELDPIKLNNWIVQYASKHSGSISTADARYLLQRVGPNQQLLAQEIDKLLLHENTINKAAIDLLTEASPQSTIFELLDAAFAGNHKIVNKIYKEQRSLKVEPQQIMSMIAWQLHILAIVKSADGRPPAQIAKEAGLNPYVVSKSIPIATKINSHELKNLIKRALELDVRLKSQSIDSDDALLHFLFTIF